MISVVNIYSFSLPHERSRKGTDIMTEVFPYVQEYLKSEDIDYNVEKKSLGKSYEVTTISANSQIFSIHFFYVTGEKRYYYPDVFCEIHVNKDFISNSQKKTRTIFLLSNIFECFDHVDEKNILIEFHSSLRESLGTSSSGRKKHFHLRHNFIDIGEIGNLDEKYNTDLFQEFIAREWGKYKSIGDIKTNYPENYRTLLVFLYHVFSLEKNVSRMNTELENICTYTTQRGENPNIELSKQRIHMVKKGIEKNLGKYKTTFEHFFKIVTGKDIPK